MRFSSYFITILYLSFSNFLLFIAFQILSSFLWYLLLFYWWKEWAKIFFSRQGSVWNLRKSWVLMVHYHWKTNFIAFNFLDQCICLFYKFLSCNTSCLSIIYSSTYLLSLFEFLSVNLKLVLLHLFQSLSDSTLSI